MTLFMYLFIFLAKLIEVTMLTFRTVMIMRGNPIAAATIGFFEVVIWISALGKVMTSLDDTIGIVIYAAGFAIGNYVGSKLETRIGIGFLKVEIIVEKEYEGLIELIREKGYGVTSMDGKGKDSQKEVLIVMLRRKEIRDLQEIIFKNDIPAVMTIQDVKTIYGGVIRPRKLRVA